MAPNVLFYLQHNGEEYVTPSFEGKTLRQMFEAGFDRGALDRFDMGSVQLTINTQSNFATMDTPAADLVGRLTNPGAQDLDIYVVAQEPTGTKQNAATLAVSFSDAEAIMEKLEGNGWDLDEEDSATHTYTFRNGASVREIVVTRDDFSTYANVGVGKLIAAVKLGTQLNRNAEAPVPASLTSDSINDVIYGLAASLGVEADQISITIRGQ